MIYYKYYYNKFYFLLVLLFNIILFNNNQKNEVMTDNPELKYYNNQTLHLFKSTEKCTLTLFFFSGYRKYNNSLKIEKINLREKNDFITFYGSDSDFKDYYGRLQTNGLIKSNYKYEKNNLFMYKMNYNSFNVKKYYIHNLDKYQKVYKYINGYYTFSKKILHLFYTKMKELFYYDYNYMPETYVYPEQNILIHNKFKNYKIDLKDLWLVKPSNKCSGQGIIILNSLDDISLKEYVLTKYITNVNLINGKKYDLRLYVLISGLKPLRIYFYKEGFARIAAEKYNLEERSIKNKFVHFTNRCKYQ